MNSTVKKPLIFILALILAFLLPVNFNLNASAKSVAVGSSLFTDIDNVTITGTTTGLKLSSKGKQDTSVKYANKLYFKDFSLKLNMTQPNFNALTFTILTENSNDDFTGNISDSGRTTVIKLEKAASGMTASIGDTEEDIDKPFTGSIELKYDTASDKFSIKSGTEYIIDKAVLLNKEEAYLTIGFEGVEVTKTAEIVITEINGQSFGNASAGYANDELAPVMRMKNEFLTDEAPINIAYEVPVYGLDVISSTIKYEIKVLYSADSTFDENDTETETYNTAKIQFPKAGFYRIEEIKVKDGNDNFTTDCEDFDYKGTRIIIKASKWNNNAVVISTFNIEEFKAEYLNEISAIYNGGAANKFQFKTPAVFVKSAPKDFTENPKLVNFKMRYKAISASSWSYIDGLTYTANSTGTYVFQIQAIDRLGNVSNFEDSPEIQITFIDVTAPKVTVSGFTFEQYINQEISLPTASIKDDMDSAATSTIKVYYIKDKDGKDISGDKKLVSETATFTPDKLGWYEVIYSAKDKTENETILKPMTFEVVEIQQITPEPKPIIDLNNTWNIVFLCIAAASALGLIIIPFIKPKEETEK